MNDSTLSISSPLYCNRALAGALFLVLGCAASTNEESVIPTHDANFQPDGSDNKSEIARLRSMGPEGLSLALAAYDEAEAGPAKNEQALLVDAVAAQRYATSSRLYWYTDIEEAKQASAKSDKPILSLRLLGNLDEDFSCANSRMFRTVLYANQKVSNYMRDNFVLHWSSEREVPKVTIDFGQGRVMKSTIAGNSAHYILTSEGRPVDVVPGLYSPNAFVQELEKGLTFAQKWESSGYSIDTLKQYHLSRISAEAIEFGKASAAQQTALIPYRKLAGATNLLAAEVLTVSKLYIEQPVAVQLDESPMNPRAVRDSVNSSETLDSGSRKLIVSMAPSDWGLHPSRLQGEALETMLAELQKRVAGDTLINRHGLHLQIHRIMSESPKLSFEELNARIYSDVFVTPADDPWLGMAQPEGFTGLPADGLSE